MFSLKFHLRKKIIIMQSCLFLFSCSGLEKAEQEKIRSQNAKGEYIYRNEKDRFYTLRPPEHQEREAYPWEEKKALK